VRGELFILSAPSGAGKTTLVNEMLRGRRNELAPLTFAVSHTTRPARRGERHGSDYFFIDRSEFEAMIDQGRFLEWAHVHNRLYGTSVDQVEPQLQAGVDVLLDIDVQGAVQVLDKMPQAQSIFLLPPSYEDLEARLRGRGLDDPLEIDRRLEVARQEIQQFSKYRYVIINTDVQRASDALAAIVLGRRYRLNRAKEQAEAIAASFHRPLTAD
jgi:guanylate kinase